MPMTHYPKQAVNVLVAWVWPHPRDKPNFLNFPRFSTVNQLKAPLEPNKSVTFYHEAQNFTRFFGSLFSEQSLELACSFSNDEVAPDGSWVTDENLKDLHYDAEALRQTFDPTKPALSNGSKFFFPIFGRWVRVELTNKGKEATKELRVFIRCSVF